MFDRKNNFWGKIDFLEVLCSRKIYTYELELYGIFIVIGEQMIMSWRLRMSTL